MRDASMEHDMLMEQMNHQLIEKQNAQIYNATLKERNRIANVYKRQVSQMLQEQRPVSSTTGLEKRSVSVIQTEAAPFIRMKKVED